MISKNQVRRIVSLHKAKHRNEQKQFIAEGPKVVGELIASETNVIALYATADWQDEARLLAKEKLIPVFDVTCEELGKISTLVTPNQVLAVAGIKNAAFSWSSLRKELCLVLDGIRDPGNLGTIIRIADWFGVGQIICSIDTVDLYNPKVIQSSMGSAFRVKVFYQDLEIFLKDVNSEIPVFGAFLDGVNLHNTKLPTSGILMIGSESHGITESLSKFVTQPLFIPSFLNENAGTGIAESLNASVAAAILLYEFRRQNRKGVNFQSECSCNMHSD